MTTGISTAAVPVLESTPLIKPTITMIATISERSEPANLVTIAPILFAIPVSKSAPPTMNIATNKMTLLSMNPANAVFTSNTPVTTRPQQTIIDVTPSGIFSNTNMITANRRNNRVIVVELIFFLLAFCYCVFPSFCNHYICGFSNCIFINTYKSIKKNYSKIQFSAFLTVLCYNKLSLSDMSCSFPQ